MTSALDFLFDHAVEALVVMAAVRDVLDVIDAYAPKVPAAYLLTGDQRAPWSVSVDQEEGVALIIDHLVSFGHERIQHVAGPTSSTEAELRATAIAAHLARRGLATLPTLNGDWTPQSGYEVAARLDPSATAVFCGNDQMAMGLICALVDSGLRVPEDISVTGFDDIPESAFIQPPLTTVRQDFPAVGELAVELLVAALSGQDLPDTTPLRAELVVRASVAAPRKPESS